MNTAKKHAGHALRQIDLVNWLLNNLQQFNLKPTTKLVLLYLAGCYNPKHADVFPKQKTIALKMGISEASVIRAISELHKEGLIISERKYTNRYKFTSRILNLGGMEDNFLQTNNMQDKNYQNDVLETCNLQDSYIEHEKEHKKEQTKKSGENVYNGDDLILYEYAKKKAKYNVHSFIKAIKEKGGDKKIISEYKKKKNVTQFALRNIQETQKLIAEYNVNHGGSPYNCDMWKKLGEKIKNSHMASLN